jgi:uncharacterized protein YjbI with pentapeptide repeats
VTKNKLAQAKSLKGTIMPDGTKVAVPDTQKSEEGSQKVSGQELIRRYKAGERDFSRTDLRGVIVRSYTKKKKRGRYRAQRANLSGIDLSEANLSEASLIEANLRGANLSRANLREANLSWANLREANLSGADLSEADLHLAKLGEANLSNAILFKANLYGAVLSGVNLTEADLSRANVTDEQLAQAKSLHGTIMPDGLQEQKYEPRRKPKAQRRARWPIYETTGGRVHLVNPEGGSIHGTEVVGEQLAQVRSLKGAALPDGTVHAPPGSESTTTPPLPEESLQKPEVAIPSAQEPVGVQEVLEGESYKAEATTLPLPEDRLQESEAAIPSTRESIGIQEALEGKLYKTEVTFRRRNRALIEAKKANSDGRCEVCGFCFEKQYSAISRDCLVAHHISPIAHRSGPSKTSLDDIALLCPNCHAVAHTQDPPIPLEDLRRMLRKH